MIEEFKKKLKEEGFEHIFDWTDEPFTKYEEHAHKGRVSFYIVEGSITMNLENMGEVVLKKNDHFQVPVGVNHTAEVGPDGCTFVVGEEIEGDS